MSSYYYSCEFECVLFKHHEIPAELHTSNISLSPNLMSFLQPSASTTRLCCPRLLASLAASNISWKRSAGMQSAGLIRSSLFGAFRIMGGVLLAFVISIICRATNKPSSRRLDSLSWPWAPVQAGRLKSLRKVDIELSFLRSGCVCALVLRSNTTIVLSSLLETEPSERFVVSEDDFEREHFSSIFPLLYD